MAGWEDKIFPIEFAYKKLEEIYRVSGHPERLEKYAGPGGHRFYAKRVWSWLEENLR
ncbi:MAG: hypothetical protein ACUVXI_17570 [bacterium]